MGNVTITYASLTTLVNDSSLTAANAEALIDQGIDELNANGLDLSNLTGVAGSKTLTVASKYAGAIKACAVAAYVQYYTNAGADSSSFTLGAISKASSTNTTSGKGNVQEVAHQYAKQLTGRSFKRT